MLSVTFSSLFSLSPITEGQSSGSREVTGRALRRLVLSLLWPLFQPLLSLRAKSHSHRPLGTVLDRFKKIFFFLKSLRSCGVW